MFVGVVDCVANLHPECILHGALIGDGRDDVIAEFESRSRGLKECPRVVARFKAVEYRGEREPAVELFRLDAEQARLLGAVEVEAVGVVAVAQSERHEADARHEFLVEAVMIGALPGVVHVMHDGDGGFAYQRKAAGAGCALVGVDRGVFLKYTYGGDHETATGQHTDCGHAASSPTSGVALAKAGEGESVRLAKRARLGQARQPRRRKRQPGQQQHRACAIK